MLAVNAIKEQLATLSPEDRAELATYLLESLDPQHDEDAAEQWNQELVRREAEVRSGDVQGELADDVMERLQRKHS